MLALRVDDGGAEAEPEVEEVVVSAPPPTRRGLSGVPSRGVPAAAPVVVVIVIANGVCAGLCDVVPSFCDALWLSKKVKCQDITTSQTKTRAQASKQASKQARRGEAREQYTLNEGNLCRSIDRVLELPLAPLSCFVLMVGTVQCGAQ